VHGRDLVSGVVYRNPAYEKHSVGTRIWDLSFEWAAKNNYEKLDMGGGFDYKQRWAPQEGERIKFRVCPPYLFAMKQALRLGRRLSANVVKSIHHRGKNPPK
jgi:CelD/BcsL family acetyltransferase involved in cellulose biosynthesis